MRRLWIADVHANLPAFEAVLADAGEVGEIIFLGDIVSFGPHPAACVERLMALHPRAIRGNHDVHVLERRAVSGTGGPEQWYRHTVEILSAAQMAYLEALPETLTVRVGPRDVVCMHQVPGAPYLHPDMPDEVLRPFFRGLPEFVICGHSHRAMDRTVDGRRVIVLPPVGQPRNGDPRAGYALEEDGHFAVRYVLYDVERVIGDIAKLGLEPGFCRRWTKFVRTGHDAEWSREYRA